MGAKCKSCTFSRILFGEKSWKVNIPFKKNVWDCKTTDSPHDQLEALQKLIVLEPSEKSKFYFSKYQKN